MYMLEFSFHVLLTSDGDHEAEARQKMEGDERDQA